MSASLVYVSSVSLVSRRRAGGRAVSDEAVVVGTKGVGVCVAGVGEDMMSCDPKALTDLMPDKYKSRVAPGGCGVQQLSSSHTTTPLRGCNASVASLDGPHVSHAVTVVVVRL